MTNIKTKIIEALEKNNVTMIPKWKLLLFSSLGVIGIAFALLLAIFVISLLIFVLSRYGLIYMPFFGFMATVHTLSSIPLILLVCAVLLFIVIEILSRQYAFSFKRPLLVTVFFSVFLVSLIGFFVSESGMHEYVHGYAKDHNIEMMRRVYDRPLPFRPLSGGRDVLRGEVIEVTASGTTLRLFDGTTITAYASSSLNSSVTLPEVGDTVVIFGVFDSETHFSIEKIRQMGDGGMGGMMGKREKRGEEQMMIR